MFGMNPRKSAFILGFHTHCNAAVKCYEIFERDILAVSDQFSTTEAAFLANAVSEVLCLQWRLQHDEANVITLENDLKHVAVPRLRDILEPGLRIGPYRDWFRLGTALASCLPPAEPSADLEEWLGCSPDFEEALRDEEFIEACQRWRSSHFRTRRSAN